jgi:hypothetical protein
MTGGLSYILRSEAEQVLNLEFVQPFDLEQDEEQHLRQLLESHFALTDSPVARRLLALRSLPFVRIQPLHFQGTLETAWSAVPTMILDKQPKHVAPYIAARASAAPHYA